MYVALGAVSMAIASTLMSFFFEYSVRYNLDPKLDEFVCESFRDEIKQMYQVVDTLWNTVESAQAQEWATWGYVAREFVHWYRFDAVFAADRFGVIV